MTSGWQAGPTPEAAAVQEQTSICLKVYAEDPSRVLQDANNERRIAHGGYATRQLEELAQNAVDAAQNDGERIEIVLTDEALYVANDGQPFTEKGVRSVMASDVSAKSDETIGKFGIGFKSLLAITRSPRVFSRSVSFVFDSRWAEGTLRREGYTVEHYPTMRLARLLDPQEERASDTVLDALMAWASTVVVAPLDVHPRQLADRLRRFQSEFVLFSPHINQAVLRDDTTVAPPPGTEANASRTISQKVASNGVTELHDGTTKTEWVITRTKHRPSAEALSDAGHVAGREQLEIQYALPVRPGTKLGSFWAHFPTSFKTTMAGIANAPWKLSDDRTALLDSTFNRELLDLLPKLFARALVELDAAGYSQSVLDAMPARGREERNWADKHINEPIYSYLRSVPSLPDGTGALRSPRLLRWAGELETEWLAAWADVPGAPLEEWVHAGAYATTELRSKVDRLITDGPSLVEEWLEALVTDQSVESSAAAIILAAHISRRIGRLRDEEVQNRAATGIRQARLIRLEDGTFARPSKGRVFVRIEGEDRSDVVFVDGELTKVTGVEDDLRQLGIVVMDRSGELRARLTAVHDTDSRPDVWQAVWRTMRELPSDTALRILREDLGEDLEGQLRVRTAAGEWALVGQAFLPGGIVPADGSRDRSHLIDPAFHREDMELLREIGAVDVPQWRHEVPDEPWMDSYKQGMRGAYAHNRNIRPQQAERALVTGSTPAWPLQPLIEMSEAARAAATTHILAHALPPAWKVQLPNSKQDALQVIPPEAWFLRKYGLVQTTFGPLHPQRALQPMHDLEFDELPIADVSERTSEALQIKGSPDDLTSNDWNVLKRIVDSWTRPEDDERRYAFYAWLPGRIDPTDLVVRAGRNVERVPLQNIGVTADRTVYESMLEAQIPGLLVIDPDDVDIFQDNWGTPLANDLLQEEVVSELAGEAEYLTDLFPPLKLHLSLEDQEARVQPVSRLVKMIATSKGQIARPIQSRREGDVLLLTAQEDAKRLEQVSDLLGLGIGPEGIQNILTQMAGLRTSKLRAAIRSAPTVEDRLLKAIGIEPLRRSIPAQALLAMKEGPDEASGAEIATLARAVHGINILKQFRAVLEEKGLQPPKEWTGRRLTREWVQSLGFPTDWAGFPTSDRPAVEMIDGPAALSPLHEYQEFVTNQIRALLIGVGTDRGMVSLPTGAGKTRVAVEALIDAVRDRSVSRDVPLLWIAQSDELCEQAAETWSYVWRAKGASIPMRLARLWSNNEAQEEPGAFQLVIATIKKLASIRERSTDDYEWLRTPSVVVIDEAHASITPEYTAVLDWLGRGGRSRDKSERKPLIGLTATPFRGTSDEETVRLVRRYDSNRLDRGAFTNADAPYEELQDMGVLARVNHHLIDGTDVELTGEDEAEIRQMRHIPSAVTERLGSDLERTLRVVDAIADLPADWTVLTFAPSVENARVLAALLTHRDIPSIAISADTDAAARRHYIERFRAGEIRVLTNYNVLTQGFDAPNVEAVFVARPTFSPNVYQQMIGRGLRGPRNGGSEEVLIVNVQDNFAKYGDLLAFNKFEYLWRRR